MAAASLLACPKAFIHTLLVVSVGGITSLADVRSDTVSTGKHGIMQKYICQVPRWGDGWSVRMCLNRKRLSCRLIFLITVFYSRFSEHKCFLFNVMSRMRKHGICIIIHTGVCVNTLCNLVKLLYPLSHFHCHIQIMLTIFLPKCYSLTKGLWLR